MNIKDLNDIDDYIRKQSAFPGEQNRTRPDPIKAKLSNFVNEFKESEHPRDAEGKFTDTTSGEATLKVTGRELGEYKDIKELRLKAIDYYKKNLQGKKVINPMLGEIKFTMSGYKKPISFSADYRKLLLFPYLPTILKYGTVLKSEPDKKSRTNIKSIFVIRFSINLKNKKQNMRVIVRRDNNGNLYYDHYIKNP